LIESPERSSCCSSSGSGSAIPPLVTQNLSTMFAMTEEQCPFSPLSSTSSVSSTMKNMMMGYGHPYFPHPNAIHNTSYTSSPSLDYLHTLKSTPSHLHGEEEQQHYEDVASHYLMNTSTVNMNKNVNMNIGDDICAMPLLDGDQSQELEHTTQSYLTMDSMVSTESEINSAEREIIPDELNEWSYEAYVMEKKKNWPSKKQKIIFIIIVIIIIIIIIILKNE